MKVFKSVLNNLKSVPDPWNFSKVSPVEKTLKTRWFPLCEQILDQRDIPVVSEKIFTPDISMVRRQKMVIFGVLKVFISNFTYYNLY